MGSEPHILIVGAGLTGLLIAQGLKKANVASGRNTRFTVFESEEEGTFRPKEWTMGLHWSVPLLEEMVPSEMAERIIPEASVDASLDYVTAPQNGSRIYDGVTGGVLKELVSEGKLLRVSRRKLRKLISEGIDVRFGHRLADITYPDDNTVTAHFTNGQNATGTLLVGTDGPRSLVRSHLFQHDPSALVRPLEGIVHLSATFSFADAERAAFVRSNHPVWSMMIHPDIFTYICIQDVPSPDRPEDWTFFLFVCWLGEKDPALSLAEVKALAQRKAETMQEPFRSAIRWIPEDVMLEYVDIGRWVAKEWDSRGGRVTLAGDAAHPMPPYRGQGLNHAVLDASNFVKVVGEIADGGEQRKLVGAFGDEVARRGAEETELSTKNAYMLLQYEDFKESPYMKHGLSKQ